MNLNVSWGPPLGPEFCDAEIQFVWGLGFNLRLGFRPQHDVKRCTAEVFLDRQLQVRHVAAPEVEPVRQRSRANEGARDNSGGEGQDMKAAANLLLLVTSAPLLTSRH